MAYRRRHSTPRSATFEEFRSFSPEEEGTSSPSLAAKAIRASAAHRESSLSSAYDGDSAAFSSSSSSTSSSASSAYTHPGRRNFHKQVTNAMAAKAKLLMRELKTVKADMAFAKQRCAQLEEENKVLRENRQKGDNPADDDLVCMLFQLFLLPYLIRHQLETLLAEKARLVHDNTVYERENLFLREIVEYHQLTMQDVVYLDEGIEEVTEVYPIHQIKTLSSPSCSAYETSTAGNSCPATLRSNTMLSLSTDASGFGSLSSPDSPNRTFIVKKVADGEVNPLPSPAAEGSMQQHSPSPTPH
ncbi:hypothetical protein B296_00055083 [Ensete ventricosum]|uniref:Uncharacterized protein n=1 Tax=Ensete ventricosum TaxID=4639 RepID=A0A426Y1C7_ENSVE|nr:hypothetical protein B296_00055083 [Ensete ventricosum]